MSPGPFKNESGFKFKDVKQIDVGARFLDERTLEHAVNKASAAFLQYVAPRIDSFMSLEEFLSLDKLWSVQEIDKGQFMFARLFTSGVSNGRPDNPFHQGFIYGLSDVQQIVKALGPISGLSFPRPADFVTWVDWLNPRGDEQLELAVLEDFNPPLPDFDDAEWARRAESIFEVDPDESLQILSRFDESLRAHESCGIPSANQNEFLEWVSFVQHLLPLSSAWSLQFSSNAAGLHLKAGTSATVLYRSEAHMPRARVSDWANLVKAVVESGVYSQVENLLGKLSFALDFDPSNGSQSLAALPLACCLLESDLLDKEDLASVSQAASQLLLDLPLPNSWTSDDFMNWCFSELEEKQTVLRYFPSADYVYQNLSRLGVSGASGNDKS